MINGRNIFLEFGYQDYLTGSPIEGTRILQLRQIVLGDIDIDEYKALGFDTYYKLVEHLEKVHPGIHVGSPITIIYYTQKEN